jgi:NAD(P)-dependent dehydrogenase (short-subunit alcohol dehydrogenase family)
MYMKKYDLSGRVAVVTGGGRGIGLACAQALAEAGGVVVIAEVDAAVAASGKAELEAAGFSADVVLLDVTKPDDVTRVADEIVARHGRIDILVNNAGIARSGTPGEEVTDEHWLNVIDVNLNGVFWCCRAFGRHMLERGVGAVVNIGSMSGFIVNKPQPQSYYNASKAAVHHLTRSLAAEWGARGVRINAVAPTYIETPLTKFGMEEGGDLYRTWIEMTPMARIGQPDEIASVVLFLASDAASLMTGSIVLADAGYSCW